MSNVPNELRGLRAEVGRAYGQLHKAEWALHCAKTALHNAVWRLGRSGVKSPGIEADLKALQELANKPWDDLDAARARANGLAAILGVMPRDRRKR